MFPANEKPLSQPRQEKEKPEPQIYVFTEAIKAVLRRIFERGQNKIGSRWATNKKRILPKSRVSLFNLLNLALLLDHRVRNCRTCPF
jgi:hypothetical protein